jgi:phosphoglycerate dehydrogenase-like enzyme
MPLKILVTDPTMIMHERYLRQSLPADVEWVFVDAPEESALGDLLSDSDVYVGYQLSETMGQAARKLKLLQVSGTGTDEIDFASLHGDVVVANTFNHERSIAEWVVMAMLALGRQLIPSDRHLRMGIWDSIFHDPAQQLYPTLRNKTLCLVGFGHIGREIALLVGPFEMDVRAVKRRLDVDLTTSHGLSFIGGLSDLPRLLKEADYLVLALPVEPETRGLIGRPQLATMKTSAYLLNVARAGLVDEDALYDALAGGRIAGAALDVWYQYPREKDGSGQALPGNRRFQVLDNVIMTPHSSGSTEETYRLRAADVAQNIKRFLTSEPLVNVIRPWPKSAHDDGDRLEGRGGS